MFSVTNVYLAAIIHGVLQIAVLLFHKRGNRKANQILAFLIGLLVLLLWNVFVKYAGLPLYLRSVDALGLWTSPFLWGPALYFYVGTITLERDVKPSDFAKHFAVAGALFVAKYVLQGLMFAGIISQPFIDVFNNIGLMALYIHLTIYFFTCFQMLREYDQKLKLNFSEIEKLNLSWLRALVGIFAAVIAFDMCLTVPGVLRQEPIHLYSVYLFAESLAVFAIGYFSILHTNVLHPTEQLVSKPRYEGSPIDEALSVELAQKLVSVMDRSKPYMNNELRLADLAELVGVSPYYLSQVINEQHGKNFYDFVNEYRAKHAAELLAGDEKSNITKVAYDAGFNNRVSFNNAFKKHMGMTPSQYRSVSAGQEMASA